MEPTSEQGHINAALSGYSVQTLFQNTNFVANQISPPVFVEHQSDSYFVTRPREGFSDEHLEEMMYGDVATQLDFVEDQDTYYTRLYAKRKLTPDGVARNADEVHNFRQKARDLITHNIAIRRERILAALMTEQDNYSAANWNAAIAAWDTDHKPKLDVDVAVRAIELASNIRPNTIMFTPKSYDIFTNNDHVESLIIRQFGLEFFQSGKLPGEMAYNLRVVRAGAIYDESAPLVAESLAYIWENSDWDAGDDWVWIGYVDPNPTRWTAGFSTSFVWNMNPAAMGFGARMREYYDQDREGWWDEIRTDFNTYLTNADAGAMITGVETSS